MTQFPAINALTAGINRLRTKGGASNDGLYDLLNGYVTLAGTIVSRPGTVEDATLPAGTVGLSGVRPLRAPAMWMTPWQRGSMSRTRLSTVRQ